MSERKIKVILDNNNKEQTFTITCDLLNFSSFLQLLKISGFVDEISNLCFVDGVFYDNFDYVNFMSFEVINVFSTTFFRTKNTLSENSDGTLIPQVSQQCEDYSTVQCTNDNTNTYDMYEDYYCTPQVSIVNNVDGSNDNGDNNDNYNTITPQVSNIENLDNVDGNNSSNEYNVFIGDSYDSDVDNPYTYSPRCFKKRVNTPEAPRKRRKRRDDSDYEDEDGSDESHVRALYCIECFGFDTSPDNPIVMCSNLIACHKNCRKDGVCRKLF